MSGGSLVYPVPFLGLWRALPRSGVMRMERGIYMKGYDPQGALEWIVGRVNAKALPGGADHLREMIASFIQYDLHFMRVTGVLDEDEWNVL